MRDLIYEAALQLFASHGYGSTGLREIARVINVNPGSLYYHIESKQILLFDLVESTLNDLIAASRRVTRSRGSREKKLAAFVKCFMDFADEEPSRMLLLMREVIHLTPEQKAHMDALNHSYAATLDSLLVSTQCPQHRHPSLAHLSPLTKVIISLLYGYLHCRLSEQEAGSDPLAIVRHITAMSRETSRNEEEVNRHHPVPKTLLAQC